MSLRGIDVEQLRAEAEGDLARRVDPVTADAVVRRDHESLQVEQVSWCARCRVVGTFPDEAATRLAGVVLLGMHDEWQVSSRRYFSEGSMAKLAGERDNDSAEVPELVSAGLPSPGISCSIPTTRGTRPRPCWASGRTPSTTPLSFQSVEQLDYLREGGLAVMLRSNPDSEVGGHCSS